MIYAWMKRTGQSRWRDWVLLVIVAAPFFFLGQAGRSFWITDEPFVAEVGREMLASGDWMIPRLNGEPFLEKPPLHYALVAASFKVFGQTPFAARLPSALCGLLTVLAIYFLGRKLFGRRKALFGSLLFPVLFLPFYVAHYTLVDASLVLFVTAGLAFAVLALERPNDDWAILGLWASAGLAYMAKGIVGPVLLGGGLVVFALVEGRHDMFRPKRHILGMTVFLAMAVPWWISLWVEGDRPFLREALIANTIGRAFAIKSMVPAHDSICTHAAPFYDYIVGLFGNFLPWTPALLLSLAPSLTGTVGRLLKRKRQQGEDNLSNAGVRLLTWVFIVGFILLSIAHAKRAMYLAPLFPCLALLTAWRLLDLDHRSLRWWEKALLVAQSAVLGLFLLAVPAARVYLEGIVEGKRISAWTWASAVILWAGAAAAWWIFVGFFKKGNFGRMHLLFWGQAATGFFALVILCFPMFEHQKSFRPFFERGHALEAARGTVPRIFTSNESYVGLAGLYFGRTLPFLEKPFPIVAVDVLTDEDGLHTLPKARVRVLLSEEIRGPGHWRALYLVQVNPIHPRVLRSENRLAFDRRCTPRGGVARTWHTASLYASVLSPCPAGAPASSAPRRISRIEH